MVQHFNNKRFEVFYKINYFLFLIVHLKKPQIIIQARAKRGLLTELRKYHTMTPRFNWGPKNVYFGKTHFRDPNINARIF